MFIIIIWLEKFDKLHWLSRRQYLRLFEFSLKREYHNEPKLPLVSWLKKIGKNGFSK